MFRKEMNYETPSFEVMEVRAEGCIATSLEGGSIKDWESDDDDVNL